MLRRRTLLLSACALAVAAPARAQAIASAANEARYADSEWRRVTDEQWQARLSELAYGVLRHERTERAGTSPLNEEHRRGLFVCAGCGLQLFRSRWKFESGTGWPSFTRVMLDNIGTRTDNRLSYPRTEYHCARCLGHQGHVFEDGPRPTGLRYCNNGAALRFIPS